MAEYANTPQTLPFGQHAGQPLSDVPTSYLSWVTSSARLSSGLAQAVAGELTRRGEIPPALPARAEVQCSQCGPGRLHYGWAEMSNGRAFIRRRCPKCGQSHGMAPLVEPYTTWATANGPPPASFTATPAVAAPAPAAPAGPPPPRRVAPPAPPPPPPPPQQRQAQPTDPPARPQPERQPGRFTCACGSPTFRARPAGEGVDKRMVLLCTACAAPLLDVPLSGVVCVACEVGDDHPATKPPPPSWPWLVMLRQRGGPWQVIAKGSTLGQAWDAAMHSWQRGDLLAVPVRPPNGKPEADPDHMEVTA